jgi:hypothetical protein
MQKEVENLRNYIQSRYPAANPILKIFPSGACILDITIASETYVMEFHTNIVGIGVSRASTATYGWEGYEQTFSHFEEAKRFILKLLECSNG